jgi:hypothetical protein
MHSSTALQFIHRQNPKKEFIIPDLVVVKWLLNESYENMFYPYQKKSPFWYQQIKSKWVIVAKCQLSNISAISWREQVNFQWDYDEVRFVLDQRSLFDFYRVNSLKQQSADNIYRPTGTHYPDSEPTTLLFLLNAECSAENQEIPIL